MSRSGKPARSHHVRPDGCCAARGHGKQGKQEQEATTASGTGKQARREYLREPHHAAFGQGTGGRTPTRTRKKREQNAPQSQTTTTTTTTQHSTHRVKGGEVVPGRVRAEQLLEAAQPGRARAHTQKAASGGFA